jgi:hypothetical protein
MGSGTIAGKGLSAHIVDRLKPTVPLLKIRHVRGSLLPMD